MLGAGKPVLTSTECMEVFRANRIPMSPQKFWGNVASGEYAFVSVCPGTKRRTATIYIKDLIDYLHGKGVEIVLPFEVGKENNHA